MSRIPLIGKVGIIWVSIYLGLKFLVSPPLPSSVVFMYMSLVTVCVLLYVTVFQDDLDAFFGPIKSFIAGDDNDGGLRKLSRVVVFIAIPLFFGFRSYNSNMPSFEPPIQQRVIHPAPPTQFVGLYNPYRDDKEHFAENAQAGGEIFFKNCVFCHGDKLDGNGIFADGFNLRPANFTDPTTISMLQEAFLFWRISKGGIGLPEESTPWDSAMPRWEAMLSEDERWRVILFLYDYTGYAPRTWE
jgi:mono/diheme cytochrome c family protein